MHSAAATISSGASTIAVTGVPTIVRIMSTIVIVDFIDGSVAIGVLLSLQHGLEIVWFPWFCCFRDEFVCGI